jgi:hypothetical protein
METGVSSFKRDMLCGRQPDMKSARRVETVLILSVGASKDDDTGINAGINTSFASGENGLEPIDHLDTA